MWWPKLRFAQYDGPEALAARLCTKTKTSATEDRDVTEKLTALEAHRAGKLPLPPGYRLEVDADMMLLRRKDGTLVAAFSVAGTTPSEVAKTAWNDHRRNEDLAV
jgi:hypothetical protein